MKDEKGSGGVEEDAFVWGYVLLYKGDQESGDLK